jgi:hypothetical protein
MEIKFTPTQQRILAVLEDGLAHPLKELQACLDDELANSNTFSVHLNSIRKVLRPRGEDIIAKHNGRGPAYYIWVRLRRKNSE